MSYRNEVVALRAYGSPEADHLRDKAASIAARADARIAELVEVLRAMLNAAPDFASHVAAIERARAALAKEGECYSG